MFIASELYPKIPKKILQKMIQFNHALFQVKILFSDFGVLKKKYSEFRIFTLF